MAIIKQENIVEKDLFDNLIKSANLSTDALKAMSEEARKLLSVQLEMAKTQTVNATGARELAKLDKENADAIKRKIDADKQLVKLEQDKTRLLKLEEDLKQKKIRTDKLENKGVQASNKLYAEQSKKLNDLRREYKELALSQGENSKAAKNLLKQIRPLDEKLKRLDKTVGQNYRNVGNYTTAFNGLKKVLSTLGIAFGIREIGRFFVSLNEVAQQAKGVIFAFDRLGDKGADAFDKVRKSTRGLVSDLDIQKALVKFDNFNISLEQSDVLMEFLAIRATQTGDSMKYLQDSLVEGLSKESKLRIDNLGISAAELNAQLELTPNFVEAVAIIAKREVGEAGGILDEAASSQQKWNTALENFKLLLATKVKPIFDNAFEKGAKILKFLGENLDMVIPLVVQFATAIGLYSAAMKIATVASNLFSKSVSKLKFAFGWVSIALTLLGSLYFWLNKNDGETKKLTASQKALNDVNERSAEKLSNEQAELVRVFDALKNTTAGTKERQKALDYTNSKYGLTLKNLSDEVGFVNQLDVAYQNLVKSIEKKIKLEAVQEKLTILIKNKISFEKQLEKAQADLFSFNPANIQDFDSEKQNQINELQKAQIQARIDIAKEGLKGITEAMASLKNSTDGSIFDLGGEEVGGDGSSKFDKATDEVNELAKALDLGKSSFDEFLKSVQDKIQNELNADIDYYDMVSGFQSVAEEIVEVSNTSKEEISSILNATSQSVKAAEQLVQDSQQRRLEMIDEQKRKQDELISDSIRAEDRIREEALKRGLNPNESIDNERERRKRAELEKIKLDKERLKILQKMAMYSLIIQGLSTAEAVSQIDFGNAKIEGFYQGTETTLGDALGRTGKKDGHIIKADDNEAIFNPNQTKALGIGKGGNTTQDIVDMYKGGILSAQVKGSLFNGMMLEGINLKDNSFELLSKKVDQLIDNTSPNKIPKDTTTFNTLTGVLEYTHLSATKRSTRTYKMRK